MHDNFEITTAPLLHSGDKDLKKIQQIVTSTEAANMAKRAIGQSADLLLVAKKKTDTQQQPRIRSNKKASIVVKKDTIPKIAARPPTDNLRMRKLPKKSKRLKGTTTKQQKILPPHDQLTKGNQTLNLTV